MRWELLLQPLEKLLQQPPEKLTLEPWGRQALEKQRQLLLALRCDLREAHAPQPGEHCLPPWVWESGVEPPAPATS